MPAKKRKFKENKKYGYIAGGMFNEAEIAQRIKEGRILKSTTTIDWYNPIEAPFNDKATLPTASDIFWGDTKEVLRSEYIVADLTNNDPGVCYELGIAWAVNYIRDILKRNNKAALELLEKYRITSKKIVGVVSDIRVKTAGQYKDYLIPYGLNQYVIGGVLDQGQIVHSFEEAAKIFAEFDQQKTVTKNLKKKGKK